MAIPEELNNDILNTLDQSELSRERSHAENTLYWVLKLKPTASLALQIAALGHDIERGVAPRINGDTYTDHALYKKDHSERSEKIMREILERHSIEKSVIEEISELILLHETGGTEDADVLMDADSISFFDNNLEFYYSYRGLELTLKQIDYKFKRCSPRAQREIEKIEIYQSFMKKLNQLT